MPLRGPGAGRQKAAAAQLDEQKRPRRLPWKKKGLSLAEQVIAFLQWLPITKGRLAGKRMRLLPSQREFIFATFETDRRGNRPIALSILSEPKGNGKSGLCAGIALAYLLGPLAEERGAVYAASIDRGKAGILYDEVKAIILRVPEFAARVNIIDFSKRIVVLEGDGFDATFEALSADARRSQGLSPTCWLYDEAGESPDDGLAKVLLESEGKRKHTLGIILSTQADSDDHWLSKLIDSAITGDQPGTYLQLHAAPVDADPWADETIRLANPAHGVFLDMAALLKSRDRAKSMPSFEPSYRRLRLNQRADSNPEDRLIQAATWKELALPVDREKLRGRVCFGGLDLSGKHDLTTLVLAFPDDAGNFDLLPIFWTPEGQLNQRTNAEAARFKEWIAAGHMIAVPGATVRYDHVAAHMAALAKEFDINMVGFDRYRIDDLKPELDDAGAEIPLEQFGQGFVSMGPAVERFAEVALSGKLRHGGHPVLTAAVANAITVSDAAGNLKIDKGRSNGRGPVRVDGAVSMVMALQVAARYQPPPPKPSLDGFLKSPVMVI
ncbi:MAG TPA: terminase TerL endonuclease subunit [Devosia sp.]|jgi:phage terminase large subunit-like protein|nr:terminase TerL endonuclease subunit [Devosia sp.]